MPCHAFSAKAWLLGFAFAAWLDSAAASNVKCWGANVAASDALHPSPDIPDQVGVAAGKTTICVWDSAGSVQCWGDCSNGRCTPPGEQVQYIAAGEEVFCAVTKTGNRIGCWGGFAGSTNTLPPSPPYREDYAGVDCGSGHCCAWTTDGLAVCKSRYNEWSEEDVPAALKSESNATGLPVSGISAGRDYSCAWSHSEPTKVWCWGISTAPLNAPTATGTVASVTAGRKHACLLKTDGTMQCWGTVNQVQASGPVSMTGIVGAWAAEDDTCTWDAAGSVNCFGEGHLNVQDLTDVPPGLSADMVRSSMKFPPNTNGNPDYWAQWAWYACAIEKPPTTTTTTLGIPNIQCWGDVSGDPAADEIKHYWPHAVGLVVGRRHMISWSEGFGSIDCWGQDGRMIDVGSPCHMPSDFGPVAGVAAGWSFTCLWSALPEGAVRCWGDDANNQEWWAPLPANLSGVVGVVSHSAPTRPLP